MTPNEREVPLLHGPGLEGCTERRRSLRVQRERHGAARLPIEAVRRPHTLADRIANERHEHDRIPRPSPVDGESRRFVHDDEARTPVEDLYRRPTRSPIIS